jgi:DNA transformation protein and related proteins
MSACRTSRFGRGVIRMFPEMTGVKLQSVAKPDPHRFDDLFQPFGPVSLRRFFGGEGIFVDDVMIGSVFGDLIYFKTDENTRKAYLAEKTKPFSFKKHSTGETVVTTWFAVPDRLYDEPEELAEWARAALAVAVSSPTVKRKRARVLPKPKR